MISSCLGPINPVFPTFMAMSNGGVFIISVAKNPRMDLNRRQRYHITEIAMSRYLNLYFEYFELVDQIRNRSSDVGIFKP